MAHIGNVNRPSQTVQVTPSRVGKSVNVQCRADVGLRWPVLKPLESLWYGYHSCFGVCGNNSVVECDLAKVEVAGSNPVSRSSFLLKFLVSLCCFCSSAPSPSGKAEVCKTSIPGSNPGGASIISVGRNRPRCAEEGL